MLANEKKGLWAYIEVPRLMVGDTVSFENGTGKRESRTSLHLSSDDPYQYVCHLRPSSASLSKNSRGTG